MFALLLVFLLIPSAIFVAQDPAPGMGRSKREVRNLTCQPLDPATARRRHPGMEESPPTRGNYANIRSLTCSARALPLGDRSPRDELLLTRLDSVAADIAQRAVAAAGRGPRTWLVQAFYPEPRVADKIAFAVKAALAGRDQSVSDRSPTLAAGDVLVLGTLPEERAHPAACARWLREGSLRDDDAVLMVSLIDSRDVTLRVGLCSRGAMRWL